MRSAGAVRPRHSSSRSAPFAAKALLAWMALGASGAEAAIIYVDVNSPGPVHNGTSWNNAYTNLLSALVFASPGDQVWIADGTYKPTGSSDQTATFPLETDVEVYGGFAGGEVSLTQRNPDVNVTILSGNIGNQAAAADNSHHVITCDNKDGVVLDGLRIQAGHADNGSAANGTNGGGLLVVDSTIEIRNCRFSSCNANDAGGAIYGSASGIRLVDCTFIVNSADSGGAVAASQGTVNTANCRFLQNDASVQGSALWAINSATGGITNVEFSGNTSAAATVSAELGGVLFLRGCTIADNQGAAAATTSPAAVALLNCIVDTGTQIPLVAGAGSTISASFTCFHGPSTPSGSGNIFVDPLFRNPLGPDGVAGTEDDNHRLLGNSPCLDRANSNNVGLDTLDLDGDGITSENVPFDLDGNPRRTDDQLAADLGGGAAPHPDMGAYELDRGAIWFVDASASGTNDGFSWANAFTSLQSALTAQADVKFGGPAEIWVADGTYVPSLGTGRAKTFKINFGARVYGGFAGGELDRSLRDPFANPVILSGEIGLPMASDNCLHVVTFDGAFVGQETLLDGVAVIRGAANLSPDIMGGGVLFKNGASPVIRNCRFMDNIATTGGAIHGSTTSEPQISNCIIVGNGAAQGAGLLLSGGTVADCTVVANDATQAGGLQVFGGGSGVTVVNSIIHGNTSNALTGEKSQLSCAVGACTLNRCIVQCWSGIVPGTFVTGEAPIFADADGPDGVIGTIDDDLSPAPGSPAIDFGDATLLPADQDDLDGDGNAAEGLPLDASLGARRLDDSGTPNVAVGTPPLDLGALEFTGTTLVIPNVADLNNDGVVNGADLGLLLANWGTGGPVGDLNFDCTVNGADLGILLANWTG